MTITFSAASPLPPPMKLPLYHSHIHIVWKRHLLLVTCTFVVLQASELRYQSFNCMFLPVFSRTLTAFIHSWILERKFNAVHSSLPHNFKSAYFTSSICRGRQRNRADVKARTVSLFCSLALLFGGILHDVYINTSKGDDDGNEKATK